MALSNWIRLIRILYNLINVASNVVRSICISLQPCQYCTSISDDVEDESETNKIIGRTLFDPS